MDDHIQNDIISNWDYLYIYGNESPPHTEAKPTVIEKKRLAEFMRELINTQYNKGEKKK